MQRWFIRRRSDGMFWNVVGEYWSHVSMTLFDMHARADMAIDKLQSNLAALDRIPCDIYYVFLPVVE